MHLVQQLALVQFDLCDSQTYPGTKTASLDLGALTALDALERDNHFGICPIPLYDFAESEIEVLNSGANLDAVREVLKSHSLLQYFFPAPDLLALGQKVRRGKEILKKTMAFQDLPYCIEVCTTVENLNLTFGEVVQGRSEEHT